MYSNKKSFLYIKKIITLILIFSFISISTPFIKEVNANNNDEVLKDGILEFIKTDSENNKGLKGATIEFYKINESIPFLTGTTDENGFISKRGARGEVDRISDNGKIILNEGSYFFRETKAPRRYILREGEQMFDIMEGETTKEVFKNEKEKPRPSDKYNLLSNNNFNNALDKINNKSNEIKENIKNKENEVLNNINNNSNLIADNINNENGNPITDNINNENGNPIEDNINNENGNPIEDNINNENSNPILNNIKDNINNKLDNINKSINTNDNKVNDNKENDNKKPAPVIDDNKKSLEIDKTIKFGNDKEKTSENEDKNKIENENIEDVPSTGYDFTVFKYIGLALVAIGLIISFSGRKKSK